MLRFWAFQMWIFGRAVLRGDVFKQWVWADPLPSSDIQERVLVPRGWFVRTAPGADVEVPVSPSSSSGETDFWVSELTDAGLSDDPMFSAYMERMG